MPARYVDENCLLIAQKSLLDRFLGFPFELLVPIGEVTDFECPESDFEGTVI